MKRVEFFGPMGAGKSTIYTNLMKSKNFLGTINAKDEVYDILLQQIKQSSMINYGLLKLVLYSPLKHRVFSNYDFYHYLKDNEKVESFLSFFFNELNLKNHKNNAKTLVRFNYLLKDLADVAVLDKYSKAKTIIHDESLIQRGLSFAVDDSLDNFENYFENVILPDAVIFVNTSFDTIKDRIVARSKNDLAFFGKKAHSDNEVEKAYKLSEQICTTLEKKNIKILKLNGQDSIEKNIQSIEQWIKTI